MIVEAVFEFSKVRFSETMVGWFLIEPWALYGVCLKASVDEDAVNDLTCTGDKLFSSAAERKIKTLEAISQTVASQSHYVYLWVFHRVTSNKCPFNARLMQPWEKASGVVTSVSDGRMAHFSRLGERVRRFAEDAAFLSRRFLCLSGFPSFSLFLRTLKHHRNTESALTDSRQFNAPIPLHAKHPQIPSAPTFSIKG